MTPAATAARRGQIDTSTQTFQTLADDLADVIDITPGVIVTM
ncbi:hypothetical protein AB0L63_20200 [Nocardia sp. NPDC051990]